MIFPLRSSFLLFVHHCSSSFIMSPLRTSFFLFVHLFSLRSSIFLFGQVPPVTSAGFWVTSPFARQSNLTPLFPLTVVLFVRDFSSSFMISPLRSSFLLFVHHFSSSFSISPLRSLFLLFVHDFSSSFIISPLRSSFLLLLHHFSSSFIIPPLRSSFLLFVHHVSSSFNMSPLRTSFLLFIHHFSSSFIISLLRSSFLLCVHYVSFSFSISPLRTSFSLFVHLFSLTHVYHTGPDANPLRLGDHAEESAYVRSTCSCVPPRSSRPRTSRDDTTATNDARHDPTSKQPNTTDAETRKVPDFFT